MTTNGNKPKIPSVTYESDDCMVVVGRVVDEDGDVLNEGTEYPIHVGEVVEAIPVVSVGDVAALSKLMALTMEDDQGETSEALGKLCQSLSRKILSWTWTDLLGNAMDQPFRNPDVFDRLTAEELVYLVRKLTNRETVEQRKNDYTPSPTT